MRWWARNWDWSARVVVLAGFLVILWRGLRATVRMPDDFGRYLALGITTMLVVQAFMNISVVLGMMPTKGIPLPHDQLGRQFAADHAGVCWGSCECVGACGVRSFSWRAEARRARDSGAGGGAGVAAARAMSVFFVGTERGVEARLVPAAGFPLETIRIGGLKRVGAVQRLVDSGPVAVRHAADVGSDTAAAYGRGVQHGRLCGRSAGAGGAVGCGPRWS